MARFANRWRKFLTRAFQVLRTEGLSVLIRRTRAVLRELVFPSSYRRWIVRHETPSPAARQRLRDDLAKLPRRPVISLIMPVAGKDRQRLHTTIRSVQGQLYPNWELYLSADTSIPEEWRAELREIPRHDGRIRGLFLDNTKTWSTKLNNVLLVAAGDFVAPIDPGDELAEEALYWVVKEIVHSDAVLIFSDEDRISEDGNRFQPWFKPDWNPALMLSCNAFGRLGVYHRPLVAKVGGLRSGFEGSEEHDLVLRCAQLTDPERIRHVPRILYHRRIADPATSDGAKLEELETRRRVIAEYLSSLGISASVAPGRAMGVQITYVTSSPPSRVSILIPTTARPGLLEPCLSSLLNHTSYGNFEALLLVNEADRILPERANVLQRFASDPRVRVLINPAASFNFSCVINHGARHASGDILCFLNDDTEGITGDWLDHLIARVSLPGVAVAGPMLYYPDDTIQHAGVILGLGGIAGHACHHEPRGIEGYWGRGCLEQDVSCVTAACMVIRKEVFHKLNGFDEAMPVAYNDVDLCIRVRKAGWRIIWTPMAELYHHESASLGQHDSGIHAEQFSRDVRLMRQRWGPILDADPFYNRNLSLDRPYELAFPPR